MDLYCGIDDTTCFVLCFLQVIANTFLWFCTVQLLGDGFHGTIYWNLLVVMSELIFCIIKV